MSGLLVPPLVPRASADPYVRYLRDFFGRWNQVYDLFAATIGFAYAAAVRAADARAGRSVLDLCTGTGEIALRTARRGARTTAVDFTPSMLERARRKRDGERVAWLEMDARALAFADGVFDTAILSFALHDMPRAVRVQALREAARVSRGGVVILDYEPLRRAPFHGMTARFLETFETAYLRGFVESGGVAGAVADAGLQAIRLARPVPGLFALWRAGTAASYSSANCCDTHTAATDSASNATASAGASAGVGERSMNGCSSQAAHAGSIP
jgi:ubiquinone/menaquinone biosynthesis C-methylase UbiE